MPGLHSASKAPGGLGALDRRGLTPLGVELARLPVHPRLGRLLVEASRRGCLERASLLAALLPALCAGRRSFAELRRLPLLDWLRAQMSPEQSRALEREAPERIEVPSGSRIRLTYEPGRPPVLAARIQELFGLEHTPRVAAGRVPVLMHLLAPNMRPQQVTDDLESFWSTTYSQVRKELRRRYPRHAWPEDPRRAEPQRRPGGRRGG